MTNCLLTFRSFLIITVLSSVNLLAVPPVFATTICGDLPESKLRLFSVDLERTERRVVTQEEMDLIAAKVGISADHRAAHPLILIVAEFGMQVAVEHRTVEVKSDQGALFCDSPKTVDVGIGIFPRKLLLMRQAADDRCVRQVMLDHYAVHSHEIDRQVQMFISEHREELAKRLSEVKKTPAQDRSSAIKGVEAGLWSALRSMFPDMLRRAENSRQEVDVPTRLEEIRNSCGGSIRELERTLSLPQLGKRA